MRHHYYVHYVLIKKPMLFLLYVLLFLCLLLTMTLHLFTTLKWKKYLCVFFFLFSFLKKFHMTIVHSMAHWPTYTQYLNFLFILSLGVYQYIFKYVSCNNNNNFRCYERHLLLFEFEFVCDVTVQSVRQYDTMGHKWNHKNIEWNVPINNIILTRHEIQFRDKITLSLCHRYGCWCNLKPLFKKESPHSARSQLAYGWYPIVSINYVAAGKNQLFYDFI